MFKLVNGVEVCVIGLCGKARSGKDTVAGFIRESLPGYVVTMAMADTLKRMLTELLVDAYHDRVTTVFACVYGDRKEDHHPVLGKSVREMLQTLGTEWGRGMVAEDLWVRVMEQRIKREASDVFADPYAGERTRRLYVVIPDIRYNNEARLCDRIIRVVRGDAPLVARHVSENGIAEELVNLELRNEGTLDELRKKVQAAVCTLGVLENDAEDQAA